MFEKIALPPLNRNPATELAQHRCLPCLKGGNAQKRDCAIRHLLVDGYSAALIERLSRSADRPQ
ncbi:hypothetical protein [Paracoccus aestuariivivens]|uniref:Uncharacterized protein n=1 Tax=Paracoccus aestuariivivens TaxID=1820333 RepID=A0A6L6J6Q3_9RHOB|nr:hypothetical protein [Paracoccus aestuariivivens]MTH76888.1 hypothetical protein [Paracoccus aestuariivivens]